MNKKEIIKQGIDLYNKHYPNDKHTTKKEKENFVKFFIGLHDLKNKTISTAFNLDKTDYIKVETDMYDLSNSLDGGDIRNLYLKKKQFKIFKQKFKERNSSLPVIKNIWKLIKKENISEKIILDLFDGVESDLKKKVQITNKNTGLTIG